MLWSSDQAGVGYSGFAVAGDRFYTAGAEGNREFLYAFETETGKRLWAAEIGPLYVDTFWGSGPRATPVTDGKYVFTLSGHANLVCVEAQSGKRIWAKNCLWDLKGMNPPQYGYCESPLLDGNQIVFTPGGAEGAMVAFDVKNGDLLWRSAEFNDNEFPDSAPLASMVVAEFGGVRQYVQQTSNYVVGIRAKDGKLLWKFSRPKGVQAIPTPIVLEDLVFISSEYHLEGGHLLRISAKDGKFECQEVYHGDKTHEIFQNVDGDCVHVDGYVYGFSRAHEGIGPPAAWVCFELKTGKSMWRQLEGDPFGRGCVISAEGQLYLYDGIGTVALIEASPEGWKENGTFTIPSKPLSKGVGTHPAIAGGKFFLRNQKFIHCYDIKASATP